MLKGAADVDGKGLIVSLNRMEVGKGGVVTAQQEVQEKYGFPVASIVSMAEVTECLYNREVQGRVVIDDDVKAALDGVPWDKVDTIHFASEAVRALSGDYLVRQGASLEELDAVVPCNSLSVPCMICEHCSLRSTRVELKMAEA